MRPAIAGALAAAGALMAGGIAWAQPAYPKMAPLPQYRTASPAEEVALARSAAPASVADKIGRAHV